VFAAELYPGMNQCRLAVMPARKTSCRTGGKGGVQLRKVVLAGVDLLPKVQTSTDSPCANDAVLVCRRRQLLRGSYRRAPLPFTGRGVWLLLVCCAVVP
jgi:hypothetical protein